MARSARRAAGPHAASGAGSRPRTVLVIGNPNAGKTSVYNALTGGRAKVGNYPGITVEQRAADHTLPAGETVKLIDLPGTYSLSARSVEEQVAVDAVLGRSGPSPDVVVVIVDATALARSLYFARQVVATGRPVVVGLNMMDEVARQGTEIDVEKLAADLGARVVPMVASRGQGRTELRQAIEDTLLAGEQGLQPETCPEEVVAFVEVVEAAVPGEMPAVERRALALWALLSLGDDELSDIPDELRAAVEQARSQAAQAKVDPETAIITHRYRQIDLILADAVRESPNRGPTWTQRVDKLLMHPLLGGLVFCAVMFTIFQTLFAWSDPAIGLVESATGGLQGLVSSLLPPGAIRDLLVDGVIAGVGNVVVFVPQIALLFFLVAALEDTGYLARVAFVVDRLMGGVGLHGKAFVPMLSGFACAVPAVLATRTIESRRDRLLTMLVIPLTSCSARLPVYVLVIAAVFPANLRIGVLSLGALILFSLYAASVTVAVVVAAVLRRTVIKGKRPPLVLELPPYRLPMLKNLLLNTWQPVRTFLVDAGTIILALTVVMWGLLSYPHDDAVETRFESLRADASQLAPEARELELERLAGQEAGDQLKASFGGRLGRLIEPVIEPLGFDWRIGVGIIGAFAAREVFVSTLGVVFGIADANEESTPLRAAIAGATWPDGRPLFTPLSGASLLVFFLLACQCMSTVAVVKRESRSWRWPLFLIAYMSALAYGASLAIYQGGQVLGWT